MIIWFHTTSANSGSPRTAHLSISSAKRIFRLRSIRLQSHLYSTRHSSLLCVCLHYISQACCWCQGCTDATIIMLYRNVCGQCVTTSGEVQTPFLSTPHCHHCYNQWILERLPGRTDQRIVVMESNITFFFSRGHAIMMPWVIAVWT